MSKANETAFPTVEFVNDPGGVGQGILAQGGLTKREYFAAMAMQGLVGQPIGLDENAGRLPIYGHYAFQAVKLADALLKALEARND